MKKWLCLLLAGTLIFSLSACHRDQTPNTSSDVTDTNSHSSSGITTDETKTNVTDTPLHTAPSDATEETFSTIPSSPKLSNKISEPFASILNNKQSFYRSRGDYGQKSTYLSDYHKNIWKFAIVDMDVDTKNELAVMFNDGNILILRQYNETVYGYDFRLQSMYQINKDGSFLWNKDAGDTYGCSTLRFTDCKVETTELWRTEHTGSDSFAFYINNKLVSKEQFNTVSQQRNLESVDWNLWIDSP